MQVCQTLISSVLPAFFWYAAAGAIAALTIWLLIRHFFIKKGDCCDTARKGGCACPECGKCKKKE